MKQEILKYYRHGGIRKGSQGQVTLYGTVEGITGELVKETFFGYSTSEAMRKFEITLRNKAIELGQFVSRDENGNIKRG